MNILIVAAHPKQNSLCTTLTTQLVETLQKGGHNVQLEDLYATGFNPVLSLREREMYYHSLYDTTHITDEVDRLVKAEGLILVFPTWWFGFPAILKGWFDRIWSPTVAYDHADDLGPIRPKLHRLTKTFVVTTLGAPWWVDYLILRRPVKKIIRFALLGACTMKCSLEYLSFYKCEDLSQERLSGISKKVNRKAATFFHQ